MQRLACLRVHVAVLQLRTTSVTPAQTGLDYARPCTDLFNAFHINSVNAELNLAESQEELPTTL